MLLDWLDRTHPRKIINNLNADYHVKPHHAALKHDLGKKYLNSFKAAALSKKYKTYLHVKHSYKKF